jgi:hypothetical protein
LGAAGTSKKGAGAVEGSGADMDTDGSGDRIFSIGSLISLEIGGVSVVSSSSTRMISSFGDSKIAFS